MRLLLFISVLTLISASSLYAQSTGWIALSNDADQFGWCVNGVGFYPIEIWVFCYPNVNGLISAEFSLNYPNNVIRSTVTINNSIVLETEGDLLNGIKVIYSACQTGCNSPLSQTLWVTDPTQTSIEVANHPDIGITRFATCEEGNPYHTCCRCFFYINYDSTAPECDG
jgi:hypothetical protein